MITKDIPYKIVALADKKTKTDKPFYSLQLKNPETGIIEFASVWSENIPKLKNILKLNNTIILTDITVKNDFASIEGAILVKEGIRGIAKDIALLNIKKIIQKLTAIQEKANSLYQVETNTLLDLIEIHTEKLIVCPAAITHHHNYVGGLLTHIMECMNIAHHRNMHGFYAVPVDTDLLIIAAVAHDFYKIEEYCIDPATGAIQYNKEWTDQHNGHVLYGYAQWMSVECETLANIVLSHHGSYGKDFAGNSLCYRKPSTPEEIAFHNIDMQSSTEGLISIDIMEKY